MLYWTEYAGHIPNIVRSKKNLDNTIYTFDIETTSYVVLDGIQHKTIDYLNFSEEEQRESMGQATMYIWMFGINDKVYYGRTWEEFKKFMVEINKKGSNLLKTVFVHNLSFEFQFLRNIFEFENVFARKSRHLIKCEVPEYNIEFRCSYMMSNCSLEKLSEVYGLKTKKLVRFIRLF